MSGVIDEEEAFLATQDGQEERSDQHRWGEHGVTVGEEDEG
jgi:hypothetical protein